MENHLQRSVHTLYSVLYRYRFNGHYPDKPFDQFHKASHFLVSSTQELLQNFSYGSDALLSPIQCYLATQ